MGTPAAFGVSLGDIVADDPGLFRDVSLVTGQIGVPWYYVFGNHDYNRAATEDRYCDETFERYFGPSTYAFEHGKAVFIVLRNSIRKPEGGDVKRFREEDLAFVRNYLRFVPEDRLVVLMMHVPVMGCENAQELYKLIEDRPHSLSISGHTHELAHVFLDAGAGWNGMAPHHHFIAPTACGSWWCGQFDEVGIPHATMNDGGPNGYVFLDIDGANYALRFKAARRPAEYQMNIYTPDEVPAAQTGETEVLVNVFAGSAKSVVEMQLGQDAPWIPLAQTRTIDPECLRMSELSPYLDQEVLGKKLDTVFGWKMDRPSKTRHMWTGHFPENLTVGTHTLTVRTIDMFDRTYTARRIIRVR